MPQVKAGKTASLLDGFPVYSYEENKVIFKDGRVAVGFKIEAAEMERWDQDGFAAAWVGFQTALKNLPVGCVVQKTDIYYDRPYVHPPAPGQYFTQRMGDYFGNRLVLYYDGYIFLSFAPLPTKKDGNLDTNAKLKTPRPTSGLNALINKAEDTLPDSVFASVSASLAEAERYASEFMEALRALPDVKLTRMDENQIRLLYLQFMNLEFDSQPMHCQREVLNDVGTIAVGEHKVSCISMVGQGSEVHPCVTNSYGVVSPMVYPLTNFLLVPHIFTQSIQIQDTKAALADLDLDRRLNKGLSKFATQDNEIRMAEIELFSAEVRAEGKQLCLLHVSLLVWETSDKLRKQNIELASAALRSLYSSEAAIESWLTLPIFIGSLPGNGYQVPDRWLPTTTDRAACYFHWTQSYRSTRTGEYICDRFRNLKRVNLFDMSQDNQNSLTIGPSGSGKSYTMGNFIIQRFENKARQIIIDVGGSYRNVCQALTGNDFVNTYFEYDPQNPIEFNPFFLPRNPANNQWMYPDEKVTFHLSLLGTLWKAAGALSRSETVVLARYLKDYYAYLNAQDKLGHKDEEFPGMNSFYQYVRSAHELLMRPEKDLTPAQLEDTEFLVNREQYLKDIAYVQMNEFFLIVGEYAEGGRYEKVLNAKRDVDLSEYPLICFDMARVKGDPTLYPVVAMLITELSLDLFRKFPDDVKYILMDEAWSMLSGTLQDFIENMYRTIRKTKGSIGIITQGITEIVNSPIGLALIDNSATKIILRHSSESTRERLQNPLGFTPQDMALIGSIRSGSDFREFFIKQGQISTIFALEASPQLNAILSSRPDERNYLNKLIKHYQRARPQAVLDHRGQPKLDPVTHQPQYTTVYEQQLQFAVDAFVESGGKEPAAMLEAVAR
jgi:conjugal transfer ATP-binding protein TraC